MTVQDKPSAVPSSIHGVVSVLPLLPIEKCHLIEKTTYNVPFVLVKI